MSLPRSPATDAFQPTTPAIGRSTVDIVWSCLALVFSCTCVAIHPNITLGFYVSMGGCSVLVYGQPVRPHVVQSIIWRSMLIVSTLFYGHAVEGCGGWWMSMIDRVTAGSDTSPMVGCVEASVIGILFSTLAMMVYA